LEGAKFINNIVYRKLEWNDIDRFIELRKAQLAEEGANTEVDITDNLFAYYKEHLNDGTFVSWIATINDEIIATSGISFIEQPPHYGNPLGRIGIISSMYTIEAYRRKGIAKKLLSCVVNEAREYGCAVVQITSAIMGTFLYQAFGFKRYDKFYRYKLYK
jgi:GNAT superfamily N-acetyltransferase